MTRILYYLLAVLLLEIIFYYFVPNLTYIIFRTLGHLITFFFYFKSLKKRLDIFQILILLNLFTPVLSPIFHVIFSKKLAVSFEVSSIALSNLFLLIVFYFKRDKLVFGNGEKTFSKILIPYIIIPTLFSLLVLAPSVKPSTYPVIGAYLLLLIPLSISSAYFTSNRLVSIYVMLGVAFLIIASGIYSYRFYVTSFTGDFIIMRMCTVLSKYCFAMGFMTHNNSEQKLQKDFLSK